MTVRPKLFRPKILKKKKTSPGTTGNRIFRLRASSAQLGNQTELKTCGPPTFQNVRREKKAHTHARAHTQARRTPEA